MKELSFGRVYSYDVIDENGKKVTKCLVALGINKNNKPVFAAIGNIKNNVVASRALGVMTEVEEMLYTSQENKTIELLELEDGTEVNWFCEYDSTKGKYRRVVLGLSQRVQLFEDAVRIMPDLKLCDTEIVGVNVCNDSEDILEEIDHFTGLDLKYISLILRRASRK